jgi:hypothetical protein
MPHVYAPAFAGPVPPPAAPMPSSAPPSGPFSLTPGKDDTALFSDARAGFSHLLPGRPVLGVVGLRHGQPPADAIAHLQDAPVTLRYRLTPPELFGPTAAEVARLSAERHASWRAGSVVPVELANSTWLSSWGAEAAVVATYDIAPDAREDLFVLVREGLVLVVSWTYPRGFVDDPAYASFASVAEATMVWDPARWEQRGRVWPESAFVGPGLFGRTKPKYGDLVRQLASVALPPAERSQLLAILSGVVSAAGAPWVPLGRDIAEGNKRAILAPLRNERLRAFVESAFAEVVTAHDLRGLAILLARIAEGRSTSSIPPPLPRRG